MLRIFCLGQFRVEVDGQPVAIPSRQAQSLFAYLALHNGLVHRREKLAGLLWPDASDENARAYLRHGLWQIRKALESAGAVWQDVLTIDEIQVAFQEREHILLDTAKILEPKISGDGSTADLIDRVQLFKGELLPGFYDEWVILCREQVNAAYHQKMSLLLERLEKARKWDDLLYWSERWIAFGQVPEPAFRGLMIAHAARGDQAALSAAFQRCQKAFEEDLGLSPPPDLQEMLQGLIRGKSLTPDEAAEPDLQLAERFPPATGASPYKGLTYFDTADAELFFGRERLTERLVHHLKQSHFLALVGASGCGKSSVARAGVIPVLAPCGWQVDVMTPTDHPLQALANALHLEQGFIQAARSNSAALGEQLWRRAKTATGCLLVIDQFEELFSLCQDEQERKAFVDNLLAASSSGADHAALMIILRADFYIHCGQYPALRQVLSSQQEYIGPMNAEELRSAIEEPARNGGWQFEPGLVDLILREVRHEVGALPLLSHALLETWQRRSGHWMTLKGYAEAGGVHSAIARTADLVFNRQLTAQQQETARNIFLRLSDYDEEFTGIRRRAEISEFELEGGSGGQVTQVLELLSAARLITISEHFIELAHEALIREWPLLQQWLTEDRERVDQLHRLAEAAHRWDGLGRDPGELYRGARLAQVLEWTQQNSGLLNHLEFEFVTASRDEEQRLQCEKEEQRQRELEAAQRLAASEKQRAEESVRSNRRLRTFAVGISLIFIVTFIAAWVAVEQRNRSNRSIHLAHSRELISAAIVQQELNPQLSILLALEAIKESQLAQAPVSTRMESALHQAVRASKQKMLLKTPASFISTASFSRDGRVIAAGSLQGTIYLLDDRTGEIIQTLKGHQAAVFWTSFHPHGRWLVSTSRDHTVRMWDLQSGESIWTYRDIFKVPYKVTFHPDGSQTAFVKKGGVLVVVDSSTGEILYETSCDENVLSFDYSPDGSRIAIVGVRGVVQFYDPSDGQELEKIDLGLDIQQHNYLAFSPDGTKMATSSLFGEMKMWDLKSRSLIWSTKTTPGNFLTQINFSPDGQFLVTSGTNPGGMVWEAETGQLVMSLTGHTLWTYNAIFNPAGDQIITSSQDGTTIVWDFLPPREAAIILSAQGQDLPFGIRRQAAFSPDGLWIAAGEGDEGAIGIWDAYSGSRIKTLTRPSSAVTTVAFHPDGVRLVSADLDGNVVTWDASSGHQLRRWKAHTGAILAVRYSRTGDRVFSAGTDRQVRVWDADTGQSISDPFFWNVTGFLAVSPDEKTILLPNSTGILRLHDLETGEPLREYREQAFNLPYAVFSHDGQRIASFTLDGDVIVWDTDNAEILARFELNLPNAIDIAFSPDDRRLAMIGPDPTLRIFDVETAQQTLLLENLSATQVSSVVFSPDGKRLAVTSEDRIEVFLVELEDLIQLAQSRLMRSFSLEECQQYNITSGCAQEEQAQDTIWLEPVEKEGLLACYLPNLGGVDAYYFNRRPFTGMLQAAEMFDWQTVTLEPFLHHELEESIDKLNQFGCDLLIMSTDENESVAKPQEHPNQRYLFVFETYPKDLGNNVWTAIYAEDQPSFLAGYAAAAMTRTGKLGTFGGAPTPAIVNYMNGFARGVDTYNQRHAAAVELIGWKAGAEVSEGLFIGFATPDIAYTTTLELIAQGADIIFPAAGLDNTLASGEAVLSQPGVLVIGLSQDLAADYPKYAPVTLTSVTKNLDMPVIWAMEAVTNGTFSGGLHLGDLENGGVGLAPFYEFEDQIPDEIKAELEQLRQDIIAGKVKTK
jgi:WD40 repeat protein/basic membrane lipoprotein Med (substrate-binding protein (PBP1-ABC) superfamily)/DNA-binding SARP family transcriptional activator